MIDEEEYCYKKLYKREQEEVRKNGNKIASGIRSEVKEK